MENILRQNAGDQKRRKISNLFSASMIIFFGTIIFLITRHYLIAECDTNFILYEGKRIAHGGIQYWNTTSVAGRMKTVIQQWLYNLIIYKAYQLAGWHGILAVNMLQAAALWALIFRLCRAAGNSRKASFASALLALFTFVLAYGSTKPEIITGILLAINAIFVEKYVKTSEPKFLIMCMPLITLEANLHSSMWIMHVVLMLPYIIPYDRIAKLLCLPADRNIIRSYKRLPIAVACLASPVFALVNPYGADGMMYLFNSAGIGLREKANITEMQYPALLSIMGMPYLILLFFGGKFIKKIKIEHSLLFVGGFCAYGMALRNIMFLALSAAPFTASVLSLAHAEKIKYKEKSASALYKSSFSCLDILFYTFIIAGCIFAVAVKAAQPIKERDTRSSPVKAEKYIKQEKKKANSRRPTRIMTELKNGSYFERMGEKNYIDARPEIWRKKMNGKADVYDEYISTIHISQKGYEKIKEKYNFDYIIAENGSILQARCQSDQKAVEAVSGEGYVLYKLKK